MVTHIIYDSLNACSNTASKSVTINFMPTCTADFIFRAVNGFNAANEYAFNAYSQPMGALVKSYSWMIDSEEVDTGSFFEYKFLSPGLHNVCLKIKTESGCEANNCEQVIAFNKCNDSSSVLFTHHVDSSLEHAIDFIVYSSKTGGISGKNMITIPVQNLPTGQYFIDTNITGNAKRSIF